MWSSSGGGGNGGGSGSNCGGNHGGGNAGCKRGSREVCLPTSSDQVGNTGKKDSKNKLEVSTILGIDIITSGDKYSWS